MERLIAREDTRIVDQSTGGVKPFWKAISASATCAGVMFFTSSVALTVVK